MARESQQSHRPESQKNHRIIISQILEVAKHWQSQATAGPQKLILTTVDDINLALPIIRNIPHFP